MDSVSPELVALLAACRARPADDLPRLVLADWLDENDQSERAEFVRVQVELSHPTADTERTAELKGVERRLLASHESEWVAGYMAVIEATKREPMVFTADGRYGMVSPTLRFIRGLPRLSDATKILEHPTFRVWLRSPEFEWLEQVMLSYTSVGEFVKIDELPDELQGRIELTLSPNATTAEDILRQQFRLLAISSNFTAVRSLNVNGANGVIVLEEIARADVTKLVKLTVGSQNTERMAKLVASAPFVALSSLNLGRLDERGLQILIRSPFLGNLTALHLTGSSIGDRGMIVLSQSKLANTLLDTDLPLEGVSIKCGGAAFPNTGIRDAGAVALARSPLFANMHGPRLNLMMNHISDTGLTALAESEHLLRFRELVLRENKVGDVGVEALAQSPYAANLRYLDFWRNNITDRGAFALARSPYLNKVVDLCVKENQITEAGAAALHERFGEATKV